MSNHKTGELKIYYYSERGLIYYFLECFLKLNIDEQRNVLKKLINKINKNIKVDDLAWFDLVVEPSFGQYGDPDLLILSSTGEGGRYYCIFIEAKRDPLDKALKQKNSSNIICQLINKMKVAQSNIERYGKNQWSIKYNNGEKKLKNDESLKILGLIISKNNRDNRDKELRKNTEFYYVTLTNDTADTHSSRNKLLYNVDKLFSEKSPACMKENKTVFVNNITYGSKKRISSLTYYDLAGCFENSDEIEDVYKHKLKFYNKGRDINKKK